MTEGADETDSRPSSPFTLGVSGQVRQTTLTSNKVGMRRRTRKHAQALSFLAFSTALALPFSFSFIRRMDSSIVLRSLPAFLARSYAFCWSVLSSAWRASRSSMGGIASGGSLMRGESRGGDEGYGERIDDIVLHQWLDNSCLPFRPAWSTGGDQQNTK